MPNIALPPMSAALAAAHSVPAGPAGHGSGFAAVESVARVDAVGARGSNRRAAAPDREHGEEARATAPATRGSGGTRLVATGGVGDIYGRPSSPFLAQYIGQALVSGDGGVGHGSAGQIAYRAAVERDITYLGFQAPVDLYI